MANVGASGVNKEEVLLLGKMVDRSIRIVFMGTPEFAVPSLQIILDAGYPVVGVVTAPDKPGGRGMKQMISSPVKQFALAHHLPVLQPTNLKSPSFIKSLREWQADLQVVVAFRMLPQIVWDMPPLGTINLHGSLLPAYRGAAPIQWAIMRGETITGLTTFKLQHAIDTGSIIRQMTTPILPEDNAGTLHDRMSLLGSKLIAGTVDLLAKGEATFIQQDDSKSSHAPKIDHATARINWNRNGKEINNHVRGMSPFPGAWTILDGKELKIFRLHPFSSQKDKPVGSVSLSGKQMIIQTADGEVEIKELQLAGKKKMTAAEFLNGYTIKDWSVT